jgi:hypothetical protein
VTVVINELQYAPKGGEPEWIEIYVPGPDGIDIGDWTLSDDHADKRYPLSTGGFVVQSGTFLVLTKQASVFNQFHPGVAPILEMPGLPASLLNNSGDIVVLRNRSGETIDSVAFGPWMGGGDSASLERVYAGSPSGDPANWRSSDDPSGSTPGRLNDVTPRACDLRIARIAATSEEELLCGLVITLQNAGTLALSHPVVSLYHDVDNDSIPADGELRFTRIEEWTLDEGDSVQTGILWTPAPPGRQNIIITALLPGDERPRDNTFHATVPVRFPGRSIIINEIMYDPLDGGAEYVELLNRGADSIPLDGWSLRTSPASGSHQGDQFSGRHPIIPPRGFVLVASDTTLFDRFPGVRGDTATICIRRSSLSLGNDGDVIVLSDPGGNVIDSLAYLPDWHTPDVDDRNGRSLERVSAELSSMDPQNWGTCALETGGSPCRENSIHADLMDHSASLSFSPSPFSPDGDGLEDVTVISYRLPFTPSLLRVRIFDAAGRTVRHLAEGAPAGGEGALVWNGYDDGGERVRMGIYIVFLEAHEAHSGNIAALKACLVVGYKM